MLYTIVSKFGTDDDGAENGVNLEKLIKSDDEKKQSRDLIKKKIMSVARMNKMFSTLREESELLLKLKNMAPDGKIPRGLLLEGKPSIKYAAK